MNRSYEKNDLPKILFMGTPAFALTTLTKLWENNYPILGVATQPDKPAGRGQQILTSPCATFAREKELPLFQPASLKSPEAVEPLLALNPDVIVVVAYGLFLPSALLNHPGAIAVNIHGSLLPAYRGAAPIQWAIINGETKTGVTLIRVTPKMDSGPIFASRECPIANDETSGSLFEKLSLIGADLLLENIKAIASGTLIPKEQDHSQATLAKMLKKEQGLIDWTGDAKKIANLIRGVNPWPGAYTFIASNPSESTNPKIDKKLLKIYDARALTEDSGRSPGTINLTESGGIHVSCGKGSLLITSVQLEGKKKMSAGDFLKGFRVTPGNQFENSR